LAPGGLCARLAVGATIGAIRAITVAVLNTFRLIIVGSIWGDPAQPFRRADVPEPRAILRDRQSVRSELYAE
jgi:hypothetical protein